MKGYWTSFCYMGYDPIQKKYLPFVSDIEYFEYYREIIKEEKENDVHVG